MPGRSQVFGSETTMPRSISCLLLHTTTWVGICALAACSPSSFKRSADREVFGILGRKLRFVKDADDVLLDITPPSRCAWMF